MIFHSEFKPQLVEKTLLKKIKKKNKKLKLKKINSNELYKFCEDNQGFLILLMVLLLVLYFRYQDYKYLKEKKNKNYF